tara:strand:+ start:24594 stop:24845 length:252 start_codon:yes stop_codon:yes gene_type:complete
MPKYLYYCSNCNEDSYVYHLMSETYEQCSKCGSENVQKRLTKPMYQNTKVAEQKTGQITKKYIDDNKEVLEDMKKKAKSETYE